jgi:hypothetical protein
MNATTMIAVGYPSSGTRAEAHVNDSEPSSIAVPEILVRRMSAMRLAAPLLAGALMVAGAAAGSVSAWAAPATAETQDLEMPILPGTTVVNPCNGEIVTLSGAMHLVTHETLTPDGHQTLIANLNFQDVEGQGDLGNTYRAIGNVGVEINSSGQNEQSETTAPQKLLWVSTGPAPNFESWVLLHGTTDANGQPTATVVTFEARCLQS